MADRTEITSHDAVRLLCDAIQMIHHVEVEQEGRSPPCKNEGEMMLQKALCYLAFGDMDGARSLMELYETWLETGDAPWPFDHSKPPPSA